MGSGGIERRVLEGRVFTGGVAQETVREGDVTRVRLTCMPGHPACGAHGGTIAFPEPVTVGAGETIVIEIEGLPDAAAQTSAHMTGEVVITSAFTYGGTPTQRPWPPPSSSPRASRPDQRAPRSP